MKMFWKHHAAMLVGGLFIIVLIIGYVSMMAMGSDWNFSIRTISGDPSVLKEITLRGQVQDTSGVVDFVIDDNRINSHYRNFCNVSEYNIYSGYYFGWGGQYNVHYANGYSYLITDFFTSAFAFKNELGIYRHGRTSSIARIKAEMSPALISSVNDYVGFCMIEMNGRFFLTLPTDETTFGTNGIYEVYKFESFKNAMRLQNPEKNYKKLVSIPADGETLVRGLFAVRNQLCLMLVHGQSVILKVFDLKTKTFIGECTFDETNYIWDSYVQGDTLVLLFNDSKVYAFDFSEVIKQVGYMDQYDMNGLETEQTQVGKRYIMYKNHKFFIINDLFGKYEESTGYYHNDKPCPDRELRILVYDSSGTMVFHGEITTDINDDLIRYTENKEHGAVPERSFGGFEIE